MEQIISQQYENALKEINDLLSLSVDMKTVCINLHESVMGMELGSPVKFKLLRVIGEAEWRSSNMTPKLLAAWMVGQMI